MPCCGRVVVLMLNFWGRADLGHEFADADTLTTSEAKLLIDVVLTKRPKDTGEEMPMTE